MTYQLIRITPSGTRFVWSVHDTYDDARAAHKAAISRAYGAAFAFGGDAMFEPIRFVIEQVQS